MHQPHAAIPRHRTAIRRRDLSLPLKCSLRDGLINPSLSVYDYGCGHGRDVQLLTERGITTQGWDPVFFPDQVRRPSDVVNFGYVINVIEAPEERAATVRTAWELCRRLLIVSAQVLVPGRGQAQVEFGDGVLTGRGTFQKFFGQVELKTYIESVLEAEAIPAEHRRLLRLQRRSRWPAIPRQPASAHCGGASQANLGGSVRGKPRAARSLHGDHRGPRAAAGGR